MAAVNVKLTRGNTTTINNTAITDGQILFDTQTGAQYLDNNTTRISIGQTLTVDTTLSKTSYNPIANIGVAGVMVSSLNTIDSITNEGFITDALATRQLDMNLKANSNRFIFDYQNGKYGYNTDPNRGAGTFSPFKKYYDLGTGTSFNVSSYSEYQNFTVDNFTTSAPTSAYNSNTNSTVGTITVSSTVQHIKSYNSSTGVLTAYVTVSSNANFNYDGHTSGVSTSVNLPVRAYLI